MIPQRRISSHGPLLSANTALRGFTTHPSPNRSPHRQWSFDAQVKMTSLTSEPSTASPNVPDRETVNISGHDEYASIWPTYNKAADTFDGKNLTKWNTDMDILLIFASCSVNTHTCRLTLLFLGGLVFCDRHNIFDDSYG